MPIDPLTLLLASLAMAVATVVQLAAGLGLSLVAVPPLVALDPRFAPAPLLLAGVVLMLLQWRNDRVALPRGLLPWALAGLVLGTAAGFAVAAVWPGLVSRRAFGGVILLAVLLAVATPRLSPRPAVLLLAGAASGAMGAFAAVHGPLMALAVSHLAAPALRAFLGVFFLVGFLLVVAGALLAGRFGAAELGLSVALLPGVALGVALARPARRWLDTGKARPAVLAISAVSGALLVVLG